MIREHRCAVVVDLILSLIVAVFPCLVSSPVWADDATAQVATETCRSYPKRRMDLEKWLKNEMIPGRTTSKEVIAIFGGYDRTGVGSDMQNGVTQLTSKLYYNLYGLGVRDRDTGHLLIFEFDGKSGKLLSGRVGYEEERQTGFLVQQPNAP